MQAQRYLEYIKSLGSFDEKIELYVTLAAHRLKTRNVTHGSQNTAIY